MTTRFFYQLALLLLMICSAAVLVILSVQLTQNFIESVSANMSHVQIPIP